MRAKMQTSWENQINYGCTCTPLLPIVTKKLIHTMMRPLTSSHQSKCVCISLQMWVTVETL